MTMNVTSATGKTRREGGREAGGGCRGSRAVVGWESLQSLPVWQKNPGESEMVKLLHYLAERDNDTRPCKVSGRIQFQI